MQWRKKRVLDCFSHRCTLSLNWGAFTPMALPRVAGGGTIPYSTAAHTWKFPKALTVSANGNIRPICQCQMCQRQSPYLPPNSFFYSIGGIAFPFTPLSYCTQVPPMQPHIYTRLFTCQKHSKKQWARIVRHVFHVVPDTFHGAI